MTKAEFKQSLAGKTRDELTQMLLNVYSASKEARRHFEGDKGLTDEEKMALIMAAKQKIFKAFNPKRGYYAKSCVAKSNKAISEFKQSCKDPEAIAELMVYQMEQVAATDGGLEWEFYSTSFENRMEACAKFLVKHHFVARYEDRINAVLSVMARYTFASSSIDEYIQHLD